MNKNLLTIATRQSPLALAQANSIKAQLESLHPQLKVELLGLTTRADRMLNVTLSQVGGKGWFVKELEEALLDGRADLAVHSMKDMPMELPEGLSVPVICERLDARDALVSKKYSTLANLPQGARIGTASLRRQSQLRALRPDLQIENLRGNVNSRLKRLDNDEYDALILAAAGLKRLGLAERISAYLRPDQLLPAVGQGALALECRSADAKVQALIASLNHAPTYACVIAERALCRALEGGCQVPIAAYAELSGDILHLRGIVGSIDGQRQVAAQDKAPTGAAEKLGISVAHALIEQGAAQILAELKA